MPSSAPPVAGLGARAARGGAVTMAGQLLRMGVQVLSVVILARLLDPHDYGLLAMVVAVIGVGEILRDFGLSSAAVQARELSRGQRTNLFWINTALGALLALVVLACAPLLADLYDEPQVAPIARVLAVTFLLNGMITQYRADLVRRMRFSALATSDVAAPATALGVGVALALAGQGYWALVAQQVTQGIVLLVVLVSYARWAPGLPDRTAPVGALLRFGRNLAATQVLGYVANNVDSFLIGRRFGAADLGLYNRGYHLLAMTLNQLRTPTSTVAIPVLSRLSDDTDRFAHYVRRGQLTLGYTLVVGVGLVVGAAEPVVRVALGEQWLAAAPVLQFLAVAGAMQTLAYVGYWVYLARGLTAELFRYTTVTAVLKIVCVVVGSTFGITGVAAGIAVAATLEWPLSIWWLSRRTPLPARALVLGALRILAVAFVAGAAGYAATLAVPGVPVGQLALAVLGLGVTYALGFAVPPVRRDLRAVLAVARTALARRSAR
ncbi:lipopolysaccharide biosynthesis protein [Cellulomonas cellasea]|uniref:PST family polysaccharide transporter n=1 Tax=Cellulomonas cellasea TaxID=43670 RepID=A0A7W4YCS1_9CELL|nr:lipopolysaccharide biosynthesis protein [Cellulomonas cellasea]MBB2923962.1 PST family polysaccharide transporter [Cellulomonas cellasea]